ncbi:MAG TPA: T9SS type A sorting domain-containing protein, partial [Chitinophaga sp.]
VAMSLNVRTTLYYKGQLIWGTEPAAVASSFREASMAAAVRPAPGPVELTLFPNPVTSQLSVKVPGALRDAWITVMSGSGVVVRVQRISSALHALSFEGLPAGVYYVTVRNDGRETTRVIIKQ